MKAKWNVPARPHCRLLGLLLCGICQVLVAGPEPKLIGDTIWEGTQTIHTPLIITTGSTLTVRPGTTIEMGPNMTIAAEAEAHIEILGTATRPVLIRRENPDRDWVWIRADGAGAEIQIRHADISGGKLVFGRDASGSLEDAFIHDYTRTTVIVADWSHHVSLRRVHVKNYRDINFNFTRVTAKDCLFEDIQVLNGDAFELSEAPPETFVENCTFRRFSDDNADAIDINGGEGIVVSGCLFQDIGDKGLSIGFSVYPNQGIGSSRDITIRQCQFNRVATAIAIKDGSRATVQNCTIVHCPTAIELTSLPEISASLDNAFNNLIWYNEADIVSDPASQVQISYSVVEDPNVEGDGILHSIPVFIDAEADDFRLAQENPARTAGIDSSAVGPKYPVGAAMAASHPTLESIRRDSEGLVTISFYADANTTYHLESSSTPSPTPWQSIKEFPPQNLPQHVKTTFIPPESDDRAFYRLNAIRSPAP